MPGRQPPETEEGWFVSHLILRLNRENAVSNENQFSDLSERMTEIFRENNSSQQKDLVRLTSSRADFMTVMFSETLEGLETFQRNLLHGSVGRFLERVYTFLSVTELSFYRSTEEKVTDHMEETDLEAGTDEYRAKKRELHERFEKYEDMRLHPEIPDKAYCTFYPMEKRREPDQNWYQLPARERSKLMQAHGATGRKYAGDIKQIITSCVGLDDWEWGVTLYSDDAREFKRLIYEMRFDEVSAVYSDFGPFYTGFRIEPENLPTYLEPDSSSP